MCLAVALGVTLVVRSGLPNEYLSFGGMIRAATLPIKTLKYSLYYTGRNKDSDSPASAIGNLIYPAEVDVEVSSSTIARDIPVLLYHGIVDMPDRFSLKEETFAEHMFALKNAGYNTITLNEFHEFLRGKRHLDEKSFLLTFDDARIDAYYGVDPILRAFGFHAVMFVATDDSLYVPRPLPSYYIHESLLARMVKSGRWELGSHAVQDTGGFIVIDESGQWGNFLSNKKWLATLGRLETDEEYKERIKWELEESKRVMEKTFNIPIVSISYPFGDYGQQEKNNPNAGDVIEEIVRQTYGLAFKQVWKNDASYTSNFPPSDRYYLNRIEVGTTWTGDELLEVIRDARAKDLPYHDEFTEDNGWKHSWGLMGVREGTLRLESATTSTGALAFLDGARDWRNYLYSASISNSTNEAVTLVSRFQDNNNFASCVFTANRVRIEERVDGVDVRLVNVANPAGKSVFSGTLGVSVNGNDMECISGSEVLASTEINNRLDSGGVGISIWHPEAGIAGLSVLFIQVDNI